MQNWSLWPPILGLTITAACGTPQGADGPGTPGYLPDPPDDTTSEWEVGPSEPDLTPEDMPSGEGSPASGSDWEEGQSPSSSGVPAEPPEPTGNLHVRVSIGGGPAPGARVYLSQGGIVVGDQDASAQGIAPFEVDWSLGPVDLTTWWRDHGAETIVGFQPDTEEGRLILEVRLPSLAAEFVEVVGDWPMHSLDHSVLVSASTAYSWSSGGGPAWHVNVPTDLEFLLVGREVFPSNRDDEEPSTLWRTVRHPPVDQWFRVARTAWSPAVSGIRTQVTVDRPPPDHPFAYIFDEQSPVRVEVFSETTGHALVGTDLSLRRTEDSGAHTTIVEYMPGLDEASLWTRVELHNTATRHAYFELNAPPGPTPVSFPRPLVIETSREELKAGLPLKWTAAEDEQVRLRVGWGLWTVFLPPGRREIGPVALPPELQAVIGTRATARLDVCQRHPVPGRECLRYAFGGESFEWVPEWAAIGSGTFPES